MLSYGLVVAVVAAAVSGLDFSESLWAAPVAVVILVWAIAGAVFVARGKGIK
ncbi:MAG TPA: hypothetical protein VF066_12065 [Thermoleophilaceae bacterium]